MFNKLMQSVGTKMQITIGMDVNLNNQFLALKFF